VGTFNDRIVVAGGTFGGAGPFTGGLSVSDNGSVSAPNAQLVVRDLTSSGISSGTLNIGDLQVGSISTPGRFSQTGGQVNATNVSIAQGSRYELLGGKLTLTNLLNDGALDFTAPVRW
jgi:hypothetical protein